MKIGKSFTIGNWWCCYSTYGSPKDQVVIYIVDINTNEKIWIDYLDISNKTNEDYFEIVDTCEKMLYQKIESMRDMRIEELLKTTN